MNQSYNIDYQKEFLRKYDNKEEFTSKELENYLNYLYIVQIDNDEIEGTFKPVTYIVKVNERLFKIECLVSSSDNVTNEFPFQPIELVRVCKYNLVEYRIK